MRAACLVTVGLIGAAGVTPMLQAQLVSNLRTLTGVVTTANGAPLPRVRVRVLYTLESDPAVLTDDAGEFTITLPDEDSVRVTLTKAGYAAAAVDVR